MAERFVTRALGAGDTEAALGLYNMLTLGPKPCPPDAFLSVLSHPGTRVYGAFTQHVLVAIATLHLLPNVTMEGSPYALLENVVTHDAFRKKGYGRAVLEAAAEAAWTENAYKIMVLTGQKRGARGFYEAVGFSSEDKFGMVMRRP